MCNPTLAEKRKHLGLHMEQDLFLEPIEPRPYVVLPSHRTSVGVVPSPMLSDRPRKKYSSDTTSVAAAVSSPPPWRKCGASPPRPKCMHNTKEQRECESIDVIQQLHDWAFSGVAVVTALLSSTPSVAERPATSLSTGARRPRGASQHGFLTFQQSALELHIHKIGVSLSS